MPPTFVIRPASAADDRDVGELLVEAYATQFARKLPGVVLSPERLADLRDQADKRAHAAVLVAEARGRIVGTVALYRWGAPRSEAWIEGAANLRFLAVQVECQGQGLSSALLQHSEQLARGWDAPAICLHARRGAVGVVRLYERRGYLRDHVGDIDYLPEIYLEAYALRL